MSEKMPGLSRSQVKRRMKTINRDSTDLPTGTMVRNSRQAIVTLVIVLAVIGVGSIACVSNKSTIAGSTNAPAASTTTTNVTRSNADARPNPPLSPSPTSASNTNEITLAPQPLRARTNGELVLEVVLPEGYHLNEEAPQHYEAAVTSGSEHLAFARGERMLARTSKSIELPLRLPLSARTAGAAQVRASFKVFYCRYAAGGSCRVKTLTWNVPVEVTTQGDAPHVINAQSVITL